MFIASRFTFWYYIDIKKVLGYVFVIKYVSAMETSFPLGIPFGVFILRDSLTAY